VRGHLPRPPRAAPRADMFSPAVAGAWPQSGYSAYESSWSLRRRSGPPRSRAATTRATRVTTLAKQLYVGVRLSPLLDVRHAVLAGGRRTRRPRVRNWTTTRACRWRPRRRSKRRARPTSGYALRRRSTTKARDSVGIGGGAVRLCAASTRAQYRKWCVAVDETEPAFATFFNNPHGCIVYCGQRSCCRARRRAHAQVQATATTA
jgi:hypothetical protein